MGWFFAVRSWLTGRRLVSVPFCDHCTPLYTPLIHSEEEFGCLLSRLQQEADQGRDKYLEFRLIAGGAGMPAGLSGSITFCLYRLDLRPSVKELFHGLHESCIRRKIARAQREGVTYEDGRSEELLQKFYQLA